MQSDLDTQMARIYPDGLVHWGLPIAQWTIHCTMDITWFPLDKQYCPVIYEPWQMSITLLNITAREPPVDLSYYQSSGEWHLEGNISCLLRLFSLLHLTNMTRHFRRLESVALALLSSASRSVTAAAWAVLRWGRGLPPNLGLAPPQM